ncbi:MAG: phosphate ABC transporter substrate-binding protein [Bacteroidota bacterium]|nr:phosphate ABC transporter substrate-binding protein [Bacteroidota bacterium]
MKKLLVILFPILILNSCKQASEEKSNETASNNIEISGSDTELPIVQELAKTYCQTNTMVTINVNGGGTSVGFGDILNNKSHIANASRSITDKEQAEADAKKINLIPIMFAVDAVVIVTNSKLGIDSLSLDQVGQILSGKIKNWKEVGGPDKSITVYGRDSTSGTQAFLKGKFKIEKYTETIKTFKETKEIISAVEKDITGIGYSGLGYILDRNGKPNGKIWSMPLYIDATHQAVSPLKVTDVIKGDYPLTRPLYQYVKDKPEINIKNFILFELSGDGYKVIKEYGYFPINDYQKEINKLNGLNL